MVARQSTNISSKCHRPLDAASLAAIRGNNLDGALMDMSLHGERITPAAEELVARGVRFILCTGYGREASDEQAIRDAPRLTKPFASTVSEPP